MFREIYVENTPPEDSGARHTNVLQYKVRVDLVFKVVQFCDGWKHMLIVLPRTA